MSEQLDLEIANELPPTLKKWNEPIPLTMPDGRVLVYACPQCLQAQSNVIGGDIEGRREDSFRDARRHCCCLECGAQLGRLFGLRCDDCQAKALREREAMKPVWDAERGKREQIFEVAIAKTKDREIALSLRDLMSDISEDCYCAGWLTGLEFTLWAMTQGGTREFGMGAVTQQEIDRLKTLSERAGGWWYFDDDSGQELFATLDEWKTKAASVSLLASAM